MKKILIILDKALIVIQEWILTFSCIEVTAIIVIASFMRYVLKKDLFGSEEIILVGAFWLYFMGSSLAAREDSHIAADFLGVLITNKKGKHILSIIRNTLSVLLSIVMTIWTSQYVFRSIVLGPVTSALKIPQIYMQFPMLISFFLMTVYFFLLLWKSIGAFQRSHLEVE